jgi:hypothetical protein
VALGLGGTSQAKNVQAQNVNGRTPGRPKPNNPKGYRRSSFKNLRLDATRIFRTSPSPLGPSFLQLNNEHLPGRFILAHESSRLPEANQILVGHFAKPGSQFVQIDFFVASEAVHAVPSEKWIGVL